MAENGNSSTASWRFNWFWFGSDVIEPSSESSQHLTQTKIRLAPLFPGLSSLITRQIKPVIHPLMLVNPTPLFFLPTPADQVLFRVFFFFFFFPLRGEGRPKKERKINK